jgi:starch synthase
LKPRVLHLTAELWPYARTGGLGQAVSGLAAHQAADGVDSNVLLPLYREARQHAGPLEPFGEPFPVTIGGQREELRCWREVAEELPRKLFLDHPPSFDRGGIYSDNGNDYVDNHRRFALFARGAIEVARMLGGDDGSLIIHAHDWHAALAPVYLRHVHRDRADLQAMPCVVTVHNGGFQGVFPPATLYELGLPADLWSLDFMEWYGRLNFLKGGLVFADMVTTVSPTHAREVLTEVGGFGLHHTFRNLGERLVGIRNGIDLVAWDPVQDYEIVARFGPDDPSGKRRCKDALQETWRLPQVPDTPLFAMSARLVAQKGMDQIVDSRSLRELDAQFVFLGAGEAQFENALRALAGQYPDRIAVNTNFTDRLEHHLLAGADFLMMPSLYEPCGLTQMRAQRYGALPVARRVGGLADTIEDGVTGILYDAYSPAAFDAAVQRAVALYQDRARFDELARGAMRRDFSWREPAEQYHDVYRRAYAARAPFRRSAAAAAATAAEAAPRERRRKSRPRKPAAKGASRDR